MPGWKIRGSKLETVVRRLGEDTEESETQLVLDGPVSHPEASSEMRWLDHGETESPKGPGRTLAESNPGVYSDKNREYLLLRNLAL